MYIGKRLREIRREKGVKLVELAKSSGVQIATLSRIENEKMTGTLESHMLCAKALGVDVTQLYTNIQETKDSINKKTPKTTTDVFVHSDKSSLEILTSNVLSKKMMPVIIKIEPDGATNPEQFPTGTERFLYILEGKVQVEVSNNIKGDEPETFPLSKNNTLYFYASFQHQIRNVGSGLARVISVITPVTL